MNSKEFDNSKPIVKVSIFFTVICVQYFLETWRQYYLVIFNDNLVF